MTTERPLTGSMKLNGEPLDIREYEKAGGYQAFRKALGSMTPAEIQSVVKDSGLRGRGGAGFPTGQKWSFMPAVDTVPGPRYLIANADEMEPGTFKDRVLIEGNPHQLIEGIIISAYALQVDRAYIFLRCDYRRGAMRLLRALEEAYAANYAGKNILGSGFTLDIRLHVSAGRYICGEETALLNALEGRRPVPRAKPPHPQTCGLWGRPTVINNTETFCNIPHIVDKGAAWFKGLGLTEGGTKIYTASGRVKRPGAWELPLGTPLRDLLNEHAGGMADGYSFRAVIPGGASTDFLLEEHLDVNMDFTAPQKFGSRLGTGGLIVLDDRTCPVGLVSNLIHFFSRESCGWCTPCREGLPWVAKTLQAIEDGEGRPEDIGILEGHTRLLGPGNTFCFLAPGAMEPLQSALTYFRDDFERHIREKRCPWR
ncbi:MAG: NADH-quinone oxidoreductase subunit NuoF [Nitrospiraceae bacterium]|nr:NADH-quinone oxidoreductase subunit NuoF [Nitrospiraceae bacterium]